MPRKSASLSGSDPDTDYCENPECAQCLRKRALTLPLPQRIIQEERYLPYSSIASGSTKLPAIRQAVPEIGLSSQEGNPLVVRDHSVPRLLLGLQQAQPESIAPLLIEQESWQSSGQESLTLPAIRTSNSELQPVPPSSMSATPRSRDDWDRSYTQISVHHSGAMYSDSSVSVISTQSDSYAYGMPPGQTTHAYSRMSEPNPFSSLGYPPESSSTSEGSGARETNKHRRRRGNLPKDSTEKLHKWLVEHFKHPYPTDEEKQALMKETGLQMSQISNWFINARRRQLSTMRTSQRNQSPMQDVEMTADEISNLVTI